MGTCKVWRNPPCTPLCMCQPQALHGAIWPHLACPLILALHHPPRYTDLVIREMKERYPSLPLTAACVRKIKFRCGCCRVVAQLGSR
jgi:hypothetical protein